MSEVPWLFLLLPVAAASGWLLARRRGRKKSGYQAFQLSSNYFRGLNYLLNEQPDKAIEVFLKLAEVNRETVETHLALGNLFRRRGEVDKAIRFHKHIISRSELTEEQRTQALLELGEDYMRAGLLDRAEALFSQLVEHHEHSAAASQHLLSIYQQERDWEKAIEQAIRLGQTSSEDTSLMVAQFHCELAEQAIAADDMDAARQALAQARGYRPECARARLIEARLAAREERWSDAIEAYKVACSQDEGCYVSVLDEALACFRRVDRMDDARAWIESVVEAYKGITPAIAMARLMEDDEGSAEAARYMLRRLEQRPSVRGMQYLAELMIDRGVPGVDMDPQMLGEMVRRLLDGQPLFRCHQCGFSGQTHHWQCPSCRQWETTRPVTGVMGE